MVSLTMLRASTRLARRPLCAMASMSTGPSGLADAQAAAKANVPVPKEDILFTDKYNDVPQQIDIDKALPDMPVLKPASDLTEPSTIVTTLSNGLRVASQETYGQSTTFGMFVDVGSRYEKDENSGVSHMIELMSFKATTSQSHADVTGAIEDLGGLVSAQAQREHIVYLVDILRDSVDPAMGVMADSLLNPALLPEELAMQTEVLEWIREDRDANTVVTEELHAAAFAADNGLGRPLFCSKENAPAMTADRLRAFMDEHFVADRMCLAGAGIGHEELVALAEKHFGADKLSGTGPAQATSREDKDSRAFEPAVYTGGERSFNKPGEQFSSLAMAFDCGGWHDDDLVPVCTLHTLLGGGDSFSAGGPGKGMYSRLYREVLNQHYWVESCSAFTHIHSDVGMLGIFGTAAPDKGYDMAQVIINQMQRIASEPVSEVDLSRARNQLKSSVLMNLETRSILFEDIGRQVKAPVKVGGHAGAL
jgi:processing peptidase subunit alpha